VLDKLKGACMIVYPMGLPKYDEVQAILDNDEDLAGKQAAKQVYQPASSLLGVKYPQPRAKAHADGRA